MLGRGRQTARCAGPRVAAWPLAGRCCQPPGDPSPGRAAAPGAVPLPARCRSPARPLGGRRGATRKRLISARGFYFDRAAPGSEESE